MGFIDIVLIVVIVAIGLRGFYNGLINELSGILGIVLGIFFGSRFAGSMGDWFTQSVHNFNSHSVANLIGFVIILVVIWGFFLIAGLIVSKIIKVSNFVIVDKILGFVFSSCKIFLVVGFIFYGISRPDFMKSFNVHMYENSKIYRIMESISSLIIKLPSVQEAVKDAQNKVAPTLNAAKAKAQEALENNLTPETLEGVKGGLDEIGGALRDGLENTSDQKNLNKDKAFESNQEDN